MSYRKEIIFLAKVTSILFNMHSTFDRKLDMKLKDEEQDIPQLRPHHAYRLENHVVHFCTVLSTI